MLHALARVDLGGSREETFAVLDLDDVIVTNFPICPARYNLEQITVCPDGCRGHSPELRACHLCLIYRVMHAVDLDLKFLPFGWPIAVRALVALRIVIWPCLIHLDLQLIVWYHDTTPPNQLTSGVSWCIFFYMKPVKAMTIRLSSEQAEALETVAAVEDRPVAEVIRAAISKHIDNCKNDPAFQDSLKDRLERARKLLRK